MNLEVEQLKRLLTKAYEEGWYGSKDLAEEVAAKIILDFQNKQRSQEQEFRPTTRKKIKLNPVESREFRNTVPGHSTYANRGPRASGFSGISGAYVSGRNEARNLENTWREMYSNSPPEQSGAPTIGLAEVARARQNPPAESIPMPESSWRFEPSEDGQGI
tara:strand:- start:16762 stop:17244 length:483 start_codon:yes stop_codon:yes gene_type:complete